MTAAKPDALTEALARQEEILRAIHQAILVQGAQRSGAITIEAAAGILGCSTRQVFRKLKDGAIKYAPDDAQVGRRKMVDAASVWRKHERPAPRAQRRPRGPRGGMSEAEAIGKIPVD